MLSAAELIRFGAWAQRLGRTPTPEEIRAEFPAVSRSTAYRWRAWLLEAWGIEATGAYLKTEQAPNG